MLIGHVASGYISSAVASTMTEQAATWDGLKALLSELNISAGLTQQQVGIMLYHAFECLIATTNHVYMLLTNKLLCISLCLGSVILAPVAEHLVLALS